MRDPLRHVKFGIFAMLSDDDAVLCLTQVEEVLEIGETMPEITVTQSDFLPPQP